MLYQFFHPCLPYFVVFQANKDNFLEFVIRKSDMLGHYSELCPSNYTLLEVFQLWIIWTMLSISH